MPRFRFTATGPDGTEWTGKVKAENANAARAELRERDFAQIELVERPSLMKREITKKRVRRDELMHFSRQLAAFIRAGIPILDAIETIQAENPNSRFREVLGDVAEALRAGETVSNAVALHEDVFPPFYVGILRSAELTGQLDIVLDDLAAYIERDLEARHRVQSAMTYPMVILAMSVVTAVILVTFVLPRFEKYFENFDAELPLPTRILLETSQFVGRWWWAIVALLGVLVLGAWLYARSERGRWTRDRSVLRVPMVGEIVRLTIVERFCRIMASMVGAGVPLPDALVVAAEGTNNRVFQYGLAGAREEMMRGEGLAAPLADTNLFPAAAGQMLRVGEDTGTLEQQLQTAAEYYAHEAGYKINRLTTLFEPAVIVTMGLVVGFVAIALVSAMYGIYNQVSAR